MKINRLPREKPAVPVESVKGFRMTEKPTGPKRLQLSVRRREVSGRPQRSWLFRLADRIADEDVRVVVFGIEPENDPAAL